MINANISRAHLLSKIVGSRLAQQAREAFKIERETNVDHSQKLNHVSLCTGYGGIDLGLSRALGDVRTVAYVEIEAFAVENLVAKVENELLDVAPIWSNLKTFPWSLYRGKVDILSGGFPCQPFSAAGRRAGSEDPRHLFPYILNGIRQLGKPPLVFLENVEGIISSKLKGDEWSDPEGTPVLLHVLRELERLGYDAEAGVFSAREVGAPHQRKRVFILACRSDLSDSGRALVSGMLKRGGVPSVWDSKSRDCSCPLWGGRPEIKGVQLPLRESGAGVNQVDSCCKSERRSRTSLHSERETVDGQRARVSPERDASYTHTQLTSLKTAYPAPRGAKQYQWEPQRVTKSKMGRDVDGASSGLGYAELSRSLDNRTDELRLLGNGVVPDTAERAFRQLWRSF